MTDPKLLNLEDSLKEKHLSIISKMSLYDLKKFKKHEYKKTVLGEMGVLLPDYHKKQYDQAAQCIVNFLQSEVQSLIRNPESANALQGTNSSLLSETLLQDLDSTMQPLAESADAVSDIDELQTTDESINNYENASENLNQTSQNLNDSITKLKKVANAETISLKSTSKETTESETSNKNTKCCDKCKLKTTSKKKYDQIQCTFCMSWFHETCVGINKDDPIGIWVCLICRNVPTELKSDINSLKDEFVEIIKCTQSVVKAIEVLSTKFENTIGGLMDQMTSMSRQMNRKELCITESIKSLQTTTNNLKTSLDQKACKILNKTEAVFEKVKTHTESFNTFANTTSTPKHQNVDTNKTLNCPKKAVDKTKNSNVDTNTKNSGKFTNVINKPHVSKGRPNLRLHQKRNQSPNITELSNERDNPIDLTEKKTN